MAYCFYTTVLNETGNFHTPTFSNGKNWNTIDVQKITTISRKIFKDGNIISKKYLEELGIQNGSDVVVINEEYPKGYIQSFLGSSVNDFYTHFPSLYCDYDDVDSDKLFIYGHSCSNITNIDINEFNKVSSLNRFFYNIEKYIVKGDSPFLDKSSVEEVGCLVQDNSIGLPIQSNGVMDFTNEEDLVLYDRFYSMFVKHPDITSNLPYVIVSIPIDGNRNIVLSYKEGTYFLTSTDYYGRKIAHAYSVENLGEIPYGWHNIVITMKYFEDNLFNIELFLNGEQICFIQTYGKYENIENIANEYSSNGSPTSYKRNCTIFLPSNISEVHYAGVDLINRTYCPDGVKLCQFEVYRGVFDPDNDFPALVNRRKCDLVLSNIDGTIGNFYESEKYVSLADEDNLETFENNKIKLDDCLGFTCENPSTCDSRGVFNSYDWCDVNRFKVLYYIESFNKVSGNGSYFKMFLNGEQNSGISSDLIVELKEE